jgi:hypothetical protein
MIRAAGFWALVLVVALCGCTKVASLTPVGERPLEVLPKDWDGTWLNREQPVKIRVVDQKNGVLEVAWAEEKGKRFVLESYQIQLRQAGAWTFGNLKNGEGPAPYLWGLVQKEPSQLIIWPPDPKHFKKLVQTGVLPGKVEKDGDVVLKQLTPEQLKAMMSEAQGVCFDWKKPMVFFRLGK